MVGHERFRNACTVAVDLDHTSDNPRKNPGDFENYARCKKYISVKYEGNISQSCQNFAQLIVFVS